MGSVAVTNVSKAYKRYPTRWSRLVEWMAPFAGPRHELTWVLKDIHFTVEPGEAVGIVGINGAGKSTLLKIIAGTTQPTTGSVHVNGRMAALLELGMGFDPEFTGRQNVYMAGQIMGFTVAEIERMMPEIEAFAEIGEYIDQPVRVYSSGMQMRLAFSVATARRPGILIVDEALSVGDAYFQHKSFDRIRQFRKQGTTLLIVSHDRLAIQSLCDRAILLEDGFVIRDGNPEEVMDFYNAIIAEKENATVEVKRLEDGRAQTTSGTGEAAVEDIALIDASGRRVECIDVGAPVTLRVVVRVYRDIDRLVFGYGIKDRLGQVMYGTNTHLRDQALSSVSAGATVVYEIAFPANLGPGSYSVQTALCSTDTHLVDNYEWRDLALVFNVVNISKTHFAGCAWIDPEIRISMS
ncbi:ABC transporter ATP-binding protein [Thioalkalivibrio thiocyanodenitrificans]|uniref:ABC transporter ATP-binding protein n=1 Tax=Thioalkalivibrio thiocyanodenitrificans TaxID=243063 RepID=UPI000372DE90|nr:ABC transporter ATP-binding protein [Thioalkalivibrio thiocyanodenitrificans]